MIPEAAVEAALAAYYASIDADAGEPKDDMRAALAAAAPHIAAQAWDDGYLVAKEAICRLDPINPHKETR